MAWIYLIGDSDRDGYYKIGSTKNDDVEKRLKQLQTGNSGELFLHRKFETADQFKLEKMLHRRYNPSHTLGEWFYLEDDEREKFIDECQKNQNIIDSLKDNPFYNKKKGHSNK